MKVFGDAVILCGGKSRRMGFDKSLLKIGGQNVGKSDERYIIEIMAEKLSQIFDNISLCANKADKFSHFGINIIEDIYKDGIGPAAAIHAALKSAKSKYVFAVAVDMPFVNTKHIAHMISLANIHKPPALVPMKEGFSEPLYALYSTDILDIFEEQISLGKFSMRKMLSKFDTYYLDESESRNFDSNLTMFMNLNYVEDLANLPAF
jgi:molybdopterin-guanine dinucleotide biosynthesis protein A